MSKNKPVKKNPKQSYSHVVSVLNKYYGYGDRKRFKTKKQLREKASEIWKDLKRTQVDARITGDKEVKKLSKVTVKNVKYQVGTIERRPKLNPMPQLPPDWDKPILYFDVEDDFLIALEKDFPEGISVISPLILGKAPNGEFIKLNSKSGYTYESTFKAFTQWFNDNHNQDRKTYGYLKLELVDNGRPNKQGEWRLELKPCFKDGTDAYYDFIPPNTQVTELPATNTQRPSQEPDDIEEEEETYQEPVKVPEKPKEVEKEIEIKKVEEQGKTDRARIESEERKHKFDRFTDLFASGKLSYDQYSELISKL